MSNSDECLKRENIMKKILYLLCLLPYVSHAADAEVQKSEWKGEGELGYTSTSGNTNSDSLNARLGISKEKGQWKHTASIESLKTTTDNVASADSQVFKEKSRYKFGEKAYVFGKLRYEDDVFSGFDYQAAISFGVGSQFVSTEKHTLDASIGLGYRSIKNSLTQETLEDSIVSGEAAYEYKISQTASFSEAISFESGDENTHSESETSLKSKINGNLSSKISYLIKQNSDVPAGTEKTDKILTVSLVYAF